MAEFEVSKWYCDCVDESGAVSILYTGTAKGSHGFRFHYSSLLEAGKSTITHRSLRAATPPELVGGGLRWRSKPLGIDAEWQADSQPVRATVFSSAAGSIEWECLMPRAHARLGTLTGFGYVERLTMTLAPWKLPLRTLRWGRFATASDWVVWIDWRGDYSTRLVFRNGEQVAAVAVEDDGVDFADGARLALAGPLEIRKGRLGATALAAIPGLRNSLPGRLLRIDECKWRSRARLVQPGRPVAEGFAIHERVEWPE